jgi:hypothetical protein
VRSQSISEELVGDLVSQLEICCCSVVVRCCCEKLVADVGDNLGNQRMGKVRRGNPLPSNSSEDVSVDSRVCVCVRNSVL